MARLTSEELDVVRKRFNVRASKRRESVSVSKQAMEAARNAVDVYVDANLQAIIQNVRASLPEPARTQLSARQVRRLFLLIAGGRL